MNAVTYSDPTIVRLIDENFVPVQISVAEPGETGQDAIDTFGLQWTPMILFLDQDEREARRMFGYFPPEGMAPELLLGLGQLCLLKEDYAEAYEYFQKVVKEHSNSRAIPEAIYWSGVAKYKRDDDASSLMEHWKELASRHRDSAWWTRASFIED